MFAQLRRGFRRWLVLPRDPLSLGFSRDLEGVCGHRDEVMTAWFTADLHLGHTNIIEYSGRPFTDAESMNRALIENRNEVVDDSDDVWVLGDFAMGKIDQTLALVSELRGRKLLLTGNHDRCWPNHGQHAEGWTERYPDAGFAEVHHGQLNLDVDGTGVVACHFPYRQPRQGPLRRPATGRSRPVAPSRSRPRTLATARPHDQRRRRHVGLRAGERGGSVASGPCDRRTAIS